MWGGWRLKEQRYFSIALHHAQIPGLVDQSWTCLLDQLRRFSTGKEYVLHLLTLLCLAGSKAATHRQVWGAHNDIEDSVEGAVDGQCVAAEAQHAESCVLHKPHTSASDTK